MKFDNKRVKKFFSSMDDRIATFKRATMENLANEFSDQINLESESYSSGVYESPNGLVVRVDEIISTVEQANEFVVYMYQPMNVVAEGAPYFKVLKLYQPFVGDYVPLSPDSYLRLVRRVVSEDEFNYVKDKNISEANVVQSYLKQHEDIVTRLLGVGELSLATEITEDLVWETLRKEMGIKMKRVPVWLPAIRSFRKAISLREFLSSGKLDRVLIDSNLSRIIVRLEKDSTEPGDYDRFQELILKI